jgi:hypothetical protein
VRHPERGRSRHCLWNPAPIPTLGNGVARPPARDGNALASDVGMGTVVIGDLRGGMRIVALIAAIAAVASPTASMSFGPFELRVSVEEKPGLVRLRMYVPEGVPESSVEVQIRGRNLVVHGRDRNGVLIRSREIPLSQVVRAAGVEADFAADGALIITLHAVLEGEP